MTTRISLTSALMMACLVTGLARAEDWPQWRGPQRDAKSTERSLLDQWPPQGPPLAWRTEGMGVGYSSVSVAGGRVYTLGDHGGSSYVIAVSEDDGGLAWKTPIGAAGGHRKYPGPRSSPTIDGGQLFALNQHGDLVCMSADDGSLQWRVSLTDDFGGRMMSGWKYSESPLVDNGRVVVTPGGSEGTMLALDRGTGQPIWRTDSWTDRAGYSSVVIATIHGVRQYVQLTGKSVAGVDPDSGRVLWRADRAGETAVVATPVVQGDIVFVTSSYGVGCNAFRISRSADQWTTEEMYASKDIANHHGGVVLVDGHVYGSSGSTFRCLDVESGELAYRDRSVGKGATTYADGHLYLRGEDGAVALIEATPRGLREKSRFDQPDRSDERAWAHPVIANGKLYLRDQDLLFSYDISNKQAL